MKARRLIVSLFVVALVSMMPVLAGAEVLTLAPVGYRVLPADESGMTKVVLQFDLSGMREGEGRQVYDAHLIWELNGLPTEETSEVAAYAATTAWTTVSEAPAVSEDKAGSWPILPGTYARQGGVVRLNLDRLVDGWANGTTTNHGVVLALPEMSAESLASQLAVVRLEVRYSFLTW